MQQDFEPDTALMMTLAWFGASEGVKLRAWDGGRQLTVKAGAVPEADV